MSIDIDSPAVQTHITSIQGIISRMAGNSAVCKNLCVTLVGTIGAVVLPMAQSS